ncbi:transposase [Ilumatobacter sp.]|uniref:transposase n=1 Tax=Ilumatobacter sp. TaxID=1967498 RepID=UPI003B521996
MLSAGAVSSRTGLRTSTTTFPFASLTTHRKDMTRRHRDLESSDMFHVVNRGVDRQDLFSAPADRATFEDVLARTVEALAIEIHAHCWMTNHIHLLVRAHDGDLSTAMQRLQSSYAQRYNRRTGRTGPLFEPRFWAAPVVDDPQLLQCVRYIHRNPLDIVGSTGLARYPHSSLPRYLGRTESPGWLTTELLHPMLGGDRHLRSVLEPRPTDRLPCGFVAPQRTTDLDELSTCIDLTLEERPDRARIGGRALLMALAVELRVADPPILAERLGVHPTTVRVMARRGRVAIATDPASARLRLEVLRALG